jgi:hypothetical protein
MAREEKSMTTEEKLACFERVLEIMKDRVALEMHMRGRNATFQEILYAREDAFTNLVSAVLGPHALYEVEETEPSKTRRRAEPRAAERQKNGSAKRQKNRSAKRSDRT